MGKIACAVKWIRKRRVSIGYAIVGLFFISCAIYPLKEGFYQHGPGWVACGGDGDDDYEVDHAKVSETEYKMQHYGSAGVHILLASFCLIGANGFWKDGK